ncbi:hypothetical protein ABW636_04975 [Aquimarina sp. 2201CG1-2-11]|uniref:hypothetical protein n=1 Tax=Aquimarina discodermiae TaxID=3231043 RepID=UPI003462AE24
MNKFEQEIEAYLNGEMTTDESKVFEQKISSDPKAQKEFELYREMNIIFDDTDWAITDASTQHSKIKEHETFLKSKKGKTVAAHIQNAEKQYFKFYSKNKNRRYYYAAAIAAMLLFGFFTFSKLNTSTDHQNLYATYSDWSDLPSLTLRDGHNNLTEAEKLFRQKKYSDALTIFQKYQTENSTIINWQVIVYTSIAQLETDQTGLAIANFTKLKNSNSLDANRAYWYLALAYLKVNQLEKAIQELKVLSKNPSYFNHNNGVKLLKEIE